MSTANLTATYSGNLENTYNTSSKSITVTVETVLYNPSLSGSESITTIGSNTAPIISSNMLCGGCGYLTTGWSNSTNWKLTLQYKLGAVSNGIVIAKKGVSSRDDTWLDILRDGSTCKIGIGSNGSMTYTNSFNTIALDTWYSLVLTKTGSNTITYDVGNGSTGTLTWSSLSSITTLCVGNDYWTNPTTNTCIKNIKVVQV